MQLIRRAFKSQSPHTVEIEGTIAEQGLDPQGQMVYIFRPSDPRKYSSYECTIYDSTKLYSSVRTKVSAAIQAELAEPCAKELPTSRKFVFKFVVTTDRSKFNYVVAVKRLD